MKILGHPIHLMVIHFPSALFPMDLVCSLLGFYYQDTSFLQASFFAMVGGTVLGGIAIITGTLDLLSIINGDGAVVKKAFIHGSINGTVVIAYIVLLALALKKYPQIGVDPIFILILKGALVTFMIGGNYLGGSLILKDKVGIEK